MNSRLPMDAPERGRQPEVAIPDKVSVPQARRYGVPGGAAIYVVDVPEYEVVRFSFVFRAGTSWQGAPFVASAAANNLSGGSAAMSANRIAERLDYYGSYFDVATDRDWCVVSFVCLSKFFDRTLRLAREIVVRPLFPEREVRTYCRKAKQNLILNRQKVDFIARERFVRALYGPEHPYGASSPSEGYDGVTSAALAEFYARHYTSDGCFVVMSGEVGDERRAAMEALVAELPAGQALAERRFPEIVSQAYDFHPVAGAVQSALRVGRVLFPRTHPDFTGMQVLSMALGGYFGSRLVRNLREKHGYTYGAYSAMVNFDRSGYLAIGTEVGAQFTDAALSEIFLEVERLREEPLPSQELELVKNMITGEVMRVVDGPFGVADITIENIQNGEDNTYMSRFLDEVRSITPGQVAALARKYLERDALTAVVVGASR